MTRHARSVGYASKAAQRTSKNKMMGDQECPKHCDKRRSRMQVASHAKHLGFAK
uniref:Uncharacterized protein n=1 Tax=Cucumis melo TaxID=3656 RepID=A0A9I9CV27_CUCME